MVKKIEKVKDIVN